MKLISLKMKWFTKKKRNENNYSKGRLVGWIIFAVLFVLGLCPYFVYRWKVMTITIDRTSVIISTFPHRSCVIETYACPLDEEGRESGKEALVSRAMSAANLFGELKFNQSLSRQLELISALTLGHEGEQESGRISTPFDEPTLVQSSITKDRISGVKSKTRTIVYVRRNPE